METSKEAGTLDVEFVSNMLGEPVLKLEVGEGSLPGGNQYSALTSLHVTTASGRNLRLLHKATDFNNKLSFGLQLYLSTYRREHTLYTGIAPAMRRLAESRGATELGQLPIPNLYASSVGDRSNNYLLLEDVRQTGFVMPDKFAGLELDEMLLIMRELARFHALGYALLQPEGQTFMQSDQVSLLSESNHKVVPFLAHMIPKIVRQAAKLVGQHDQQLGERALQAEGSGLPEELFATQMATDTANGTYFATVVHGDLWINNLLIRRDESGAPAQLCLIDFQKIQRGNVFEDLLNLMFTSTTPDFRQRHLSVVLDTYYDTLVAAVQQLDISLPTGFTRAFLGQAFFDFYLATYRYLCSAIPLQLGASLSPDQDGDVTSSSPNLEGDASLSTELLIAVFHAVIDTFPMLMMGEQRAIDRLVEVTREMVRLGVL